MSDTAAPTTAAPITADPSGDPMMTIVIAFLAPMFLWSGDVALARTAAIETLNAYRITTHRSLITVAKIIAFELAALCSLSQSMTEDIAVVLALRLRNNANSMDRAAERHRQALEHEQHAAAMAARTAHVTEKSTAATVAEAQKAVRDAKARSRATLAPPAPAPAPVASSVPAPLDHAPAVPSALAQQVPTPAAQAAPIPQADVPSTEQQWHAAWADAMADVAAEITAGLPSLPPEERAAEMIRIQWLTEAARALASGTPSGTPPCTPLGTQVTFADIPGLAAHPAGGQG